MSQAGQMVSVVGRLQVRSWDDNEGRKHWSTDVVIEEQYFAESKKVAGSSSGSGNAVASGAVPDGFYPIDESIEDDDLPF